MTRAIKAWRAFITMRFPLGQYLAMVGVFAVAHSTVSKGFVVEPMSTGVTEIAFAGLGCLAFFLLLRIYDEIKDYEVDLKQHPERPLALGVIRHRDLGFGILVCITVVMAAFWATGRNGIIPVTVAIGYSLLMFREFFVSRFLRPRLTTYAVTHTAVSVWLSAALLSAFTGHSLANLDSRAWAFALAAWCLFSVFEFGRKTVASSEEREGVDSYSRIFGRSGAVGLNCMTAATGSGLLLYSTADMAVSLGSYLAVLIFCLAAVGIVYAVRDCCVVARIYRHLTNAYIVAVYAGVILFCTNT